MGYKELSNFRAGCRTKVAAFSVGLVLTGCGDGAPVKELQCAEAETLIPEQLDALPGFEMRQDLNKDPLFRAATVNVAFEGGYGSGGLHRHPNGTLVVRTVKHVLEAANNSSHVGIFFPGVGWWSMAGCLVQENSLAQLGDSAFSGDTISEIRLPEDFALVMEDKIRQGIIKPLDGLFTDQNELNPDTFASEGAIAKIARADTGLYTELIIDSKNYEPGDAILSLGPFTNELGNEFYTGNVCAGRSGQPVQIGLFGDLGVTEFAIGVVSYIKGPTQDFIGLNPDKCSPRVGVLTYTRKS